MLIKVAIVAQYILFGKGEFNVQKLICWIVVIRTNYFICRDYLAADGDFSGTVMSYYFGSYLTILPFHHFAISSFYVLNTPHDVVTRAINIRAVTCNTCYS